MQKTLMIRSVLVLIACFMSCGAQAMIDAPKQINVAPGELVPALESLSKQVPVELVYQSEQLREFKTKGVKGIYTPETAVRILLQGTPLELQTDASGAMLIAPAGVNGANSAAQEDRKPASDEFRLAQVDQARNPDASAVSSNSAVPSTQTPNSDNAALGEIIVTAEKRSERLQDVPISMSVLTGSELDKSSSVDTLADVLNTVPGVATTLSAQGGGTQLTVRGVSANGPLFSGSSPVAYYVDSVPYGLVRSAVVPDIDPYDLSQVEVLRGPQGTLYGASALNGVVRVLTNDADLNNFDFKARTTLSTTDGGGVNYGGEMAVNVPIVEGKLAARLVVGDDDMSGYIDSPVKNHVNDQEINNLRLKVNAQPTDDLSIGLSAWHQRADNGAPPDSLPDGRINSVVPQPISTDYDAYGLKIAYQLPAFSISSATSYLDYASASTIDTTPEDVPGQLVTDLSSNVFSEEINLTSKLDSSWRWSSGGFYRDAKDTLNQTFGAHFPDSLPLDFSDTSKSEAVYGQLDRLFFQNQLDFGVGARYFHDDVGTQQDSPFGEPVGTPFAVQDASFNSTTPRAVLTWLPNADLTVYGSYSQGFRSGIAQDLLVTSEIPGYAAVKPDKLTNYEVGTKGNLFDRRLTFDAALYYIDWKDIQQSINVAIPGAGTGVNAVYAPALVNGQSASGIGAEFAVTAQLLEGLTLGLNASWNDLTMDSAVYSAGVVLFQKGERLANSPAYTAGTSVQYDFLLADSGLKARIAASANYISEEQDPIIGGSTATVFYGNSMLVTRMRFSVDLSSHWTTTIFGENLNNAQFTETPSNDSPLGNTRIRPRTIGIQFDYHLN